MILSPNGDTRLGVLPASLVFEHPQRCVSAELGGVDWPAQTENMVAQTGT